MSFSFSKLFTSIQQSVPSGSSSVVGIDIGSSSIKVVEIEETEKALTLRTYGELQLGPYAERDLGDTVKLDPQKQIEATVDVLRESSVSAKTGVLSMPLASSFMTVVPVQLSEDDDVESKIYIEARKYIPIPLNDVALDWVILDQVGTAETSVRDVLLVAVEHKAVSQYKGLLQAVNLATEPSEIESFSLIRALKKREDKSFAVIDLGARTSKLYIVQNGVLVRTHNAAAGGSLITKRLAKLTDMSFEQAENLKRSFATDIPHAREIQKATASVLEGPLNEFKRLLNQYESRLGTPVDRITLSGGVSAFPGIEKYVGDIFARQEVEVGNPFSKLAYAAFMEDTLTEIAPTFGVSVGAALRQFEYNG